EPDGHRHREQRQLHGEPGAVENGRAVAVEHGIYPLKYTGGGSRRERGARAQGLAASTLPAAERVDDAALLAVDVELEVLVLHFLVLAVGADGGDGGVEL